MGFCKDFRCRAHLESHGVQWLHIYIYACIYVYIYIPMYTTWAVLILITWLTHRGPLFKFKRCVLTMSHEHVLGFGFDPIPLPNLTLQPRISPCETLTTLDPKP